MGWPEQTWLGVAERAAREAGELLARARRDHARVTGEAPHDVKLAADAEAERHIIERLRRESPFPILSEEAGEIHGDGGTEGLRWIVDPLDGSVNYLKGIPFCSVSVALWAADAPRLGVVHDVHRGETFVGAVGVGAWLDGAPIGVAPPTTPDRGVLCTGFPVGTEYDPASLASFIERIRRYRKIRLLGSAALSLAYVAAARADAYMERDIRLWDVAAGIALVLGAGGTVTRWPSIRPDAMTVYAGPATMPEPA